MKSDDTAKRNAMIREALLRTRDEALRSAGTTRFGLAMKTT